MMLEILKIVGVLLIWIATDIGRKPESKIELFSWNFVIQIILVAIGLGIIRYVDAY